MGFNKSFVVKNGIEVSTDLLVGEATLNNVGVGTTLPSTKLDVQGSFQASGTGRISGINTAESIFNVGVGGTVLHVDPNDSRIGIHTNVTTNDITIVGHSTITGNVHITGITTGDYLTVSQISTLNGLNVTGVSTLADVRVNAGFVTITQLTSTNANVTGVSTVGGAVTMSSTGIDVNNIDVEALTGRGVNIDGNVTTNTLTVNTDAEFEKISLNDDKTINFGNDDDVRINYNGTNNLLYYDFRTSDGIVFEDNGVDTLILEDSGIFRPATNNTGAIGSSSYLWNNGYFTDFNISDTLTVGIVTDVTSIKATEFYGGQFIGDGSRLTGIDTSGNFQGKTIVCENVDASLPGIGTFGSVVINNPAGRITATEYYGDGDNLTNAGSSLGSGSGVERLVTTSLTTGKMTSSSTDPSLVYDFTNNRLGVGTTLPQTKFHVETASGESVRFDSAGGSQQPRISLVRDSGTDYSMVNSLGVYRFYRNTDEIYRFASDTHVFSNVTTGEAFRIDSNSNIGIGTNLPASGRGPLHVHSSNNVSNIHLTNGGSGTGQNDGMTIFTEGTTSAGLFLREAGDLRFATNNIDRARIDSSGRLLVGDSTSRSIAGVEGGVQVSGFGAESCLNLSRYSNNTGAPLLQIGKSRGTTRGNYTIVNNGDQLGIINFSGSDGVDLGSRAAQINCNVDGTPGTSSIPGRLTFQTTVEGESIPTERMRITSDGRVCIDDTGSTAHVKLKVGGDTDYNTTNANAAFIQASGTINDNTTGFVSMFDSYPLTESESFTLSDMTHYSAGQGTIGTGSAITTQYGFRVRASLTGATTNYGFYSDIASGTGRYNFYANGTADNYFAGNIQCDGTITGNLTGDVTGDVTGNADTATDSTNVRVDSESTTNAERYIVFADGGDSSNRRLKADGGIRYNPSTNTITATTFDGNATTSTNADNAGTLDGIDSASFLRSDTGDTAAGKITFTSGTRHQDNVIAEFGSGADYQLRFNGSNTIHNVRAGDVYWADNGTNKFYFDIINAGINPNTDNTGTVGTSGRTWNNGVFTNFTIDSTLTVRGAIDLADNDILRFGSGDDVEFFFNGTDFYLDLNSGGNNFIIRDGTTTRFTFDDAGIFTAGAVATDQLRCETGAQLVLNAGESAPIATGQGAEAVYINAEAGLQVNSSPDNWAGGWSARHTATICDTSGNSSFPGNISASGTISSNGATLASTGKAIAMAMVFG